MSRNDKDRNDKDFVFIIINALNSIHRVGFARHVGQSPTYILVPARPAWGDGISKVPFTKLCYTSQSPPFQSISSVISCTWRSLW